MPTLNYFVHNPRKIAIPLLTRFGRWLPDKPYLQLMFYAQLGYKLDLCNPKSFNEKLQWLKLNDRNPVYTQMVDKYEAKRYVAKIIGDEYIIPTIGVYEKGDDINFEELPNQFVLKVTHDSGGIVVCKDKSTFNRIEAVKALNKSLKENFYYMNREWPYKNVHPRIIVEKYMENGGNNSLKNELTDYKFFCFNGEPKLMFVATDRFTSGVETKFDFFDTNFNHLPFVNGYPNSTINIPKPASFELMKELACKLSTGIPHVRVDFYDVDGHVYFGELTFYHWSGFVPFYPREWDYKIGEMLDLPSK